MARRIKKEKSGEKNFVAVLSDVRSMHNVGSIFRTADGAGFSKIFLCGLTPSPQDRFGRYRPKLAKVSLGAEKTMPWEKAGSAVRLIALLKKRGYEIFAVEQSEKSIPYFRIKLTPKNLKIALIVGNEIEGLSPSILKRADKILEIPMRGAIVRQAHHPRRAGRGKESLNVAVAFGVAAFSLRRPGSRFGKRLASRRG
ncbi:MAG: TrmH family RNA methyltransferase [Parcubacteria group bacterium]|nr:TrmH family RNA methyltransferase [Parcubacteria group bacterium]